MSSGLILLMLAIVGVYSFLGPLAGWRLEEISTLRSHFSVYRNRFVIWRRRQVFCFFRPSCSLWEEQLTRWAPIEFGRAKAVSSTTVAPWLIGTMLIILVYWPLPDFLVKSTLGRVRVLGVRRIGGCFRLLELSAGRDDTFIHPGCRHHHDPRRVDGAAAHEWSSPGSLDTTCRDDGITLRGHLETSLPRPLLTNLRLLRLSVHPGRFVSPVIKRAPRS